jgi:hypothetical protein
MVQQADDDDAAQVHATVAWLDRYCQAAPAFAKHCIHEPQPGSAGATEMAEQGPRRAYAPGASYLGSGLDYLLTLLHLFGTGFVPNFAGYALARGCLEAGARAAWLFDPSLTTRQRTARGLVERIDSLENQHKVYRQGDHLTRRLNDVRATAAQDGMTVTKQSGTFDVDGERWPKTTPLIEGLLRNMTGLTEEQYWFFALLCGFTHSAGYATVLNARRGEQDAAGWIWAQTNVNISWLTGSVLMSARVHAAALDRLGQLAGRNGAPAP